jgi:hypothetical protein
MNAAIRGESSPSAINPSLTGADNARFEIDVRDEP